MLCPIQARWGGWAIRQQHLEVTRAISGILLRPSLDTISPPSSSHGNLPKVWGEPHNGDILTLTEEMVRPPSRHAHRRNRSSRRITRSVLHSQQSSVGWEYSSRHIAINRAPVPLYLITLTRFPSLFLRVSSTKVRQHRFPPHGSQTSCRQPWTKSLRGLVQRIWPKRFTGVLLLHICESYIFCKKVPLVEDEF